MNGKGDKPRPVNKKTYNTNYDAIRWRSKASGNKQVVQHPKGVTTPPDQHQESAVSDHG